VKQEKLKQQEFLTQRDEGTKTIEVDVALLRAFVSSCEISGAPSKWWSAENIEMPYGLFRFFRVFRGQQNCGTREPPMLRSLDLKDCFDLCGRTCWK